MAVDSSQMTDQAQGAESVSSAPSETQSGGVGGWLRNLFGGGDDPGDADSGQNQDAQSQEQTDPNVEQVTLTRGEYAENVRREAQSLKDREILQERRADAVSRADTGDMDGLVSLAERGDGRFAELELAKRGATYEAGQLTVSRVQQEQAWDKSVENVRTIATEFDQAILDPLVMAIPESDRARILSTIEARGLNGLEARAAITQESIKAFKAHAIDTAKEQLRNDTVFRKEVLIAFRGTSDFTEPDLIGSTGGTGGRADGESFFRSLAE